MIKLTDTKADHVLGVLVTEKISSRDIELGMNFIEEKIRTRKNIALYVEVDGLEGVESDAIVAEIRQSLKQVRNLNRIQRVALVTDKSSLRDESGIADLIPIVDVKTFSKAERDEAQAWAAERPEA